MKRSIILLTAAMSCAFAINAATPTTLVDPIPEVPKALPLESVPMGNIEDFPEYQLDLQMAESPFNANWESIETNYPGTPDWLRDSSLKWQQTDQGLSITLPTDLTPFRTSLVFRIN